MQIKLALASVQLDYVEGYRAMTLSQDVLLKPQLPPRINLNRCPSTPEYAQDESFMLHDVLQRAFIPRIHAHI